MLHEIIKIKIQLSKSIKNWDQFGFLGNRTRFQQIGLAKITAPDITKRIRQSTHYGQEVDPDFEIEFCFSMFNLELDFLKYRTRAKFLSRGLYLNRARYLHRALFCCRTRFYRGIPSTLLVLTRSRRRKIRSLPSPVSLLNCIVTPCSWTFNGKIYNQQFTILKSPYLIKLIVIVKQGVLYHFSIQIQKKLQNIQEI